jgi:hypothetical protein
MCMRLSAFPSKAVYTFSALARAVALRLLIELGEEQYVADLDRSYNRVRLHFPLDYL